MLENVYDKIREENTINYGTKVNVYGPILLGNLYSERTHFIFELLQNAEDACARARKAGNLKKFNVNFNLYPDRLEATNNGIQFDDNDVRGICGIVDSTKDQTVTQIGKFGIGFKSVYAYTISPEVYSGQHSFYIKDLVHPFYENRQNIYSSEETTFRIPFNRPDVKAEIAFEEIKKKLSNLGIRSMLFLNNLEEIKFKVGSYECKYSRTYKKDDDHFIVTLRQIDNGIQKIRETWIVFEKQLDSLGKRSIKIAYQIFDDPKTGKTKILPADGALLFVYFPTEKETHLKFIIHGPFNTTPARDNIRQNDHTNLKLIEQIGDFVAENMIKIKALNLLDVDFLKALPIDTDHFAIRESIFRPIYEKVKDTLCSDIPLLPTYNKSYTTVKQALLSRSEDMRKLVSSAQLDYLFDGNNNQWLDSSITENLTPELWKYLKDTLLIKIIDSETFAKILTETFFKKQTDEWIIRFYDFLGDQKALWRESEYGERPGILRSKPIIRLEDNSHKVPFDFNGKSIVYLPSKDSTTNAQFQNLVKETIATDKRAKVFLKALGIDEPDLSATVLNFVIPIYKEKRIVTDTENLQHVKIILQCLESSPENKKEKFLKEIQKTAFLKAINAATKTKEFKLPAEIHLGEKYSQKSGVEAYFSGNKEIWFLDDNYLSVYESSKLTTIFVEIGCIDGISVSYSEPNSQNQVIISNNHGWHSRGLNGFDPRCELEGLEHALENISVEKANTIWSISKRLNRHIYGEVEKSTKQDYQDSRKLFQYSNMGTLLNESKWLPDSNGTFNKPCEMRLSDLPVDFEKNSDEAKSTAEKLGFITEANKQLQKLCENAPENIKDLLNNAQPLLEIFESVGPEQKKRIIDSAREIMMAQEETSGELENALLVVNPNRSELLTSFVEAMKANQPQEESKEDKTWTGPTPEQEKEIKEQKIKALEKMIEDPQILSAEKKQVTQIKSTTSTEPILRQFFLEQYKGHCQICNQKLDLGSHKDPYFEIYRLDERKNLHGEWSNKEHNAICLCPNCHALLKYGGRELSNIVEKAQIVSKCEEAPEPISERNGDFYIIKVSVAGREKQLFYSPVHMASIIAFIKFSQVEP